MKGKNLDVLPATQVEQIEHSSIDNNLQKEYGMSDHNPFKTTVDINTIKKVTSPKVYRAYNKTDWNAMNKYITENEFQPYCYSNVDELTRQWHKWIEQIIEIHIPQITKHRSSIPPWVTSNTSHQMKILRTLQRR